LKEKGFIAKNFINIVNRNKKPQPLFKVELEPESRALRKNEVKYCLRTALDFGQSAYLVEASTILNHALQTKKTQKGCNPPTMEKTIPQAAEAPQSIGS